MKLEEICNFNCLTCSPACRTKLLRVKSTMIKKKYALKTYYKCGKGVTGIKP